MVKFPLRYRIGQGYIKDDNIYLGIVKVQYSRMEVQVKIISENWDGGFPRVKNVKNPPTFEASEENKFHVLGWEKEI